MCSWRFTRTLAVLGCTAVSVDAFADKPADSPPAPPSTDVVSETNPPPPAPPLAPTATSALATEKKGNEAKIVKARIRRKGVPRIHIDADKPGVRLLRIERTMSDDMGEGMLVRTVCRAPCDREINGRKGQTFFFGADGMVPSRGFTLSRIKGDIVARVHGGNLVARRLGFLFGGIGGAAVIGGVTMLAVGYGNSGAHLNSEGKIEQGVDPNLTFGGAMVLGAGIAVVLTGVIMASANKTSVTLLRAPDKSARISFEMGKIVF